MSTFMRFMLCAMLVVEAIGSGAFAQQRPGAQGPGARAPFGPCSEDVRKLCADVKPGQGRLFRCLHERASELSPACKDFERQRSAEFAEGRACREDATRLCAEVRPGQGRVAACLKSHEAELSPPCRKEIAAHQ